jgi:hypothetical protein
VFYESLQEIQAAGGLPEPLAILVDKRPKLDPMRVKLWGEIRAVAAAGPIGEAAAMAWTYISAASLHYHDAGRYAGSFEWEVNGTSIGPQPPDGAKLGPSSVVYVSNTAGVRANVAETGVVLAVPDGIVWGAYNLLRRHYGSRLSLRYFYRQYGPCLQISNPTRKVKATRKPGVMARKAKRAAA